jgi:hypothetical protein
MARKEDALDAAIRRADDIIHRTTDEHSLVTVRRTDLHALLLAASYTLPNLDIEVSRLREKLGTALAGGRNHRSDCSVHNAPAFEPTPCDCGVSA